MKQLKVILFSFIIVLSIIYINACDKSNDLFITDANKNYEIELSDNIEGCTLDTSHICFDDHERICISGSLNGSPLETGWYWCRVTGTLCNNTEWMCTYPVIYTGYQPQPFGLELYTGSYTVEVCFRKNGVQWYGSANFVRLENYVCDDDNPLIINLQTVYGDECNWVQYQEDE